MNLKIVGKTTIELTNGSTAIMTDFRPGKDTLEVKEVDLFADVILLGTRANIIATKDSLDSTLNDARRAQLDLSLDKVYVEVETDGTNYWRSEIIDGAIETDSDFFDRLARDHAPIRLWLKRKNYWEGAEAQIPLTNENGTANTTGLTVFNTNDMTGTAPTKRVNYVKMAAASVTGSIPTPPRIEMTNTYSNGTARLSKIWIGRSIDNATYPLIWFLDQTMTGDTTASTEQQISLTTLTTTFLNGANGAHYRIFTKSPTVSYDDLRLNAALYFPATSALTPMQKAPEVVMPESGITDLGTLQIPPWLPNVSGQTDIGLRIGGRRTGGFYVTLNDIFLFPANAFRLLMPRGYGLAYNTRLVDDGIIDRVWTDGWTPVGKTGHYSGYGDLITLIPGKDQRLLFLNNSDTGGTADTQTLSIKLYYRPRKLTP